MIWNFLPYFSPLPFLLSNLFLHLNWASSSSSKGSPLWHFSSSLCPLGKNKASFLEGIPKLIASSSLQSHLLASPFLPFLDLDWASSSSNKGSPLCHLCPLCYNQASFSFRFLDALSHLYKRVCPSVGPSVRPLVRRSVNRSVTRFFRFTENAQN